MTDFDLQHPPSVEDYELERRALAGYSEYETRWRALQAASNLSYDSSYEPGCELHEQVIRCAVFFNDFLSGSRGVTNERKGRGEAAHQ